MKIRLQHVELISQEQFQHGASATIGASLPVLALMRAVSGCYGRVDKSGWQR